MEDANSGGLPSIGQVDRYRLWALIQAVEIDIRNLWVDQVVRDGPESDRMPTQTREKAEANRERSADPALDYDEPLVAYLDLGEVVDLLAGSATSFDDQVLAQALVRSVDTLKSVIPVRNRLAHHRPLPERAVADVIGSLSQARRFGLPLPEVEFVSSQIRLDPEWLPGDAIRPQPWEPESSRVLHNVPYPPHDDTGLVGRKREMQAIHRDLCSRRSPAYSILGPGGNGKTALALEVLWRLIDEEGPYEAILYASLKMERLTAEGVVELSAPLRSVSDAFDAMGQELDGDLRSSAQGIADALEGVPSLLVIDNLETDIGADLSDLMSLMPDSVSFLFTSRIGLPSGFGDKALHLDQLSTEAATALFRRYARVRNLQHLAQLSDTAIGEVCDRLGRSPLGIRWLISTVEAGVPIESILERQKSDLIAFCVGSVFDSLSEASKRVAAALATASGPTTAQRLSLLTTESNLDAVRMAVRDLKDASLVTAVADPDGYEAFSLSEMALAHVTGLTSGTLDLDDAKERALEWDAAEERRRRDERNLLNPNSVLLRTTSDRESALLLRKALRTAYVDTAKAREEIETARSLAPDFYEVDRVLAFVDGLDRDAQAAAKNYAAACGRAPDTQSRGRCEYHLANQLVKMNRAHDALDFARSAHEALNLDGTRFLLGRTLLFCGEESEAIRELSAVVRDAEGRLRVMALTTLVDAHKRDAERLINDARPIDAMDAVLSGLDAYENRGGVEDLKLHETAIDCANQGLRAALRLADPSSEGKRLRRVLEGLQKNPAWRATRDRPYAQRYLTELADLVGDDLASQIEFLLFGRLVVREAERDGRIVARVERFDADHRFGFAKSGEFDYYLSDRDLIEPEDGIFLHVGAMISFVPDPPDPHQVAAGKLQVCRQIEVELAGPALAAAIEDRSGHIVFIDRNLALVRDDLSGATAAAPWETQSRPVFSQPRDPNPPVVFSLDTDSEGFLAGFLTRRGEYRYVVRPGSLKATASI